MKRHEAWRAAYRASRYLKHASIESLERRSQDINSNMIDVNEKGQIGPGDPTSTFWIELWTHILEELEIRQIPLLSTNLMTNEQFPWASYPAPPRGMRILGKNAVGPRDIVRIGQRQHIKDAMNFGRFRIAPAASYDDASLNPAIRDDELSVTAVRNGEHAVIHTFDPATGQRGQRIDAIGEMTFSRTMQENFYVICMTSAYSPRLLDDFQADALLVIKNVNRFIIRLEKAIRMVRPDLTLAANVVKYYDPYRVKPDDMEPFYSKNFRYAYQKEYRFICYKSGIPLNAEPFFIEMGTLRDIASIHILRD